MTMSRRSRYLFVRNNGLPPAEDTIDPAKWTLLIDGESVKNPTELTLNDLKSKFRVVTQHLALECAGNGRSEFFPPAKGNPWTTGGVGFPEWTGVRLGDVLRAAGIQDDAVYIGYYGKDNPPERRHDEAGHLPGCADFPGARGRGARCLDHER